MAGPFTWWPNRKSALGLRQCSKRPYAHSRVFVTAPPIARSPMLDLNTLGVDEKTMLRAEIERLQSENRRLVAREALRREVVTQAKCAHAGLYWYGAPADECGWRCVRCDWMPGEPPGFSPQHDRSHLTTKIGSILQDLHHAKIVYVSNGSGGDWLTARAAQLCIERDVYDSVSIARVLLEIEADDKRAAFWRDISAGILAGKDPRNRCKCGALATVSSSTADGGWIRTCSEHWR